MNRKNARRRKTKTGDTNRLGNLWEAVPVLKSDLLDGTAGVVAKILASRPQIETYQIAPSGDVQFSLDLPACGVTTAEMARARLVHTRWFANSAGGYLVLANWDVFNELVTHKHFLRWANNCRHGGFGMWVRPHQLKFQFHATYLNEYFNDDLREQLRAFHQVSGA